MRHVECLITGAGGAVGATCSRASKRMAARSRIPASKAWGFRQALRMLMALGVPRPLALRDGKIVSVRNATRRSAGMTRYALRSAWR